MDEELRATFGCLARWMVFNDPPEHTRLRRLVHRAFTPRAVALCGTARTIADELLDDLVGRVR